MKDIKIFFPFVFITIISYACQPSALREPAEPHPVTAEGLIASAVYAAERTGSDEVKSNILRRIALMKHAQNDTDAALDFAVQIPSQSEKDPTIADIAISITEEDERERARSLAGQIQSDYHRSRVLAAIAVAYERAEEYRRGRELAETITDPNYKARALSEIAVIYYAGGYGDLASRLFNQALQAAGREQSITHHIETLLYISQKYNEAGQRQQAGEVFSSALELTGQIRNEQPLVNVWIMILESYAQAAQNHSIIENAVEAARGMNDEAEYYRDELLSRAAIASSKAGQYDGMNELTDEIGDALLRATTAAHIAVILGDDGENERADDMLTNALAVSETITGTTFRQRTLREIGRHAAALQRFDTVETAIDKLDDPHSIADVAAHAAGTALDKENEDVFKRYMNKTVAALDSVDDPIAQAEILFNVAELYERSGSVPDANTKLIVSKVLYALD